MVFTEQQLQVKKLVDVQQDIEIDALNNGVSALSSTMQNGFTETTNNFLDIQNNLESMNLVANDRYNEFTGSVNALSNAMTQGFLDMGNTVANVAGEIQGQLNQMNANAVNMNDNIQNQFNGVNIELQNVQNTFELVNTNIGESINAYNDQITNSLSVDTLSANKLIYNISEKPVSSLTALGYDSNGRVRPVTVIANQNVVLPENAGYIYTDVAGTPYAGNVDNVVSESENLVTSQAVYNEVSNVRSDLNALHDTVLNTFWGFRNYFNVIDNNLNGVQNQLNGVNNNFIGIQNQFNGVNNNFIGIQNQFNGVNNSLSGIDNNLYFVMDSLGFFTPMNYINSSSPTNYQSLQTVIFMKGNIGNLWSRSSLLGNKYYEWNSTTNTLTFSSPSGLIVFNETMDGTFRNCVNLNQNILISGNVYEMDGTFRNCVNLNQNILIPNSVRNMRSTFMNCVNLNQNILIPDSVRDINYMFAGCYSLEQNIYVYSENVYNLRNTFIDCPLLEYKDIHIRSSIPMSTSNDIYNALVNNSTGINWTGHVVNDLPKPTTWPPAN